MLLKIFVFVLLALIINSLFTAWKHIAKGEGENNSREAAKALTMRISLSLLLFTVLTIGLALGIIQK